MPGIASGNVDERIVEMRIDHEKFESGARKTISILERLDAGLKSLSGQNADGFDQIADSLEAVDKKFSAFGTIGDQVLRNLTNKAIELVGQLRHVANELTLDQVGAGWNKYAEKTQGVQTIMAATSKDWEDQGAQMEWVNAQLEKLNWFTDETSYNFLEMVNNIGKFTSNGVKLETAVTSMEGISTWAALSGANANEASRAMYNLSQALATGTVKLIDWKSIENANMATREFKELALETAVSLGTLTKVGDNTFKTLGEKGKEFTTEQFNTELSEGWFTSDVLLSVLNQYGQFTDVLNAASNATDLTATEMLEAVDAYEKGEEGLQDIQRICDKSHLSIEELMPWLKELSSDTYELGRRAFKAAQEAKTFQEAIDATKDAVSTAWMNVFETIFGSYLEAKEFWTDVAESLYNIFAEPINQLGELVDLAFGNKLNREMDELHAQANFDELTAGLHDLGYSFKSFEDAYRRIDGKTVDELVSKYGSLENAIKKGAVSAKDFQDIMLMLAGTNEYISKTPVYDSAGHIKAFEPVYHKIITLTGERLAIYNKLIGASGRLTNTEESGLEHITTGSELFTEGLANMLGVIEDVTKAIDHAMQLLFGDNTDPENIIPWTDVLGEKLYGSLEKFNEFAEALRFDEEKGEIEALGEKIAAVASVFVTARNIISSVFGFLMSVVTGIMTALGQGRVIEHIFKAISNVVQGLLAPLRFFASLVQTAFETLAGEKLGNFNWVQMLTRRFLHLTWHLEILSKRFREFMESEEVALIVAAAFEKLQDALTWITNKLGNAFTKLVDLAKELKQAFGEGGLTKAFDVLKVKVSAFLKKHQVLQKVFEGLKTVLMLLLAPLALVGAGLMTVFTYLKNVIDKLKVKIDKEGFAGVLNSINLRIEEFVKKHPKLESALKWIQKQISRISNLMLRLQTAFSANGFSGVFSVISDEINQFLANHPKLASFITFVQNAFENIKNLASQVWKSISEFFSNIDWTTIFSNMPTWEDVGQFFSGLYTSIVTWFSDLKNKFKTGGLTAALQSIVDTVKGFFKKDNNFLKPISDTLTNIFKDFNITSLLDFVKKIGDTIGGLGTGLLAFNFAHLVRTVSWVFDSFSGLLDVPRLNAISRIISAVGVSLLMLAGSLFIISRIPSDRLFDVWATLLSMLIAIGAFVAFIKVFKAEKSLASLFFTIGSLVLLVVALYGISKMTDEAFFTGLMRLVFVLAALYAFIVLTDGLSIKSMKGLLSVAITMLIMMFSLQQLAKMTNNAFFAGLMRLVFVLAALYAFIALSDGLTPKGMKTLISMAVSVLLLAFALKRLSMMTSEDFQAGWIRIASVLILMLAFMKTLDGLVVPKNGLIAMIVLLAYIVVITVCLKTLAKENWKKLLAAGGAIAICLLGVAVTLALLGNFGGGINPAAIIALLASVVALIAIAWALGKLAAYDWKTIGPMALICLATMADLAGIIVLLGMVPLSSIAMGIAALAIILGGIALIIWGLIALGGPIVDSAKQLAVKLNEFAVSLQPFIDTISGFTDDTSASFDRFVSMMLSLMEAQFWTMLAGVLSDLTDSEALATKLSGFMANIQPFLNSITMLTEDHVTKAGLLTSLMETLTAGQFWASLGSLFGGLESDYATKLSDFATSLQPFLTSISSLTEAHSTQAGYLTSLMETLAAGQFWASLGELFNGLNSENGQKLSDFMVSLEGFLTSVGSIDQAKLDGASNLSTIMRTAFGTNFWTSVGQWFSGDNVAYGDKMSSFAGAIVPFLNTMGSIGADMVTNVTATMDLLSGINKNNTIANFGAQLQAFYQNLEGNGSFLTGGAGVVEKDLSSFQLAIQMLQEFVGVLQSLAALGDGIELGLNIISSVSTGITDNESDLTFAISTATRNALVSARNSTYSVAYNNGANIVRGVVSGINANVGLATAAAVSLATSINSAFASALEIKSPSRAMARLAAYIPAGVAVGIEHNSGVAVDSIMVLGSSILAAMQMAMLKVATVADERFDITPVITPVVDTTNMDYAAGMASGMFGRITSGLRGTIDVNADRADALASAANASTDKGSMFGEIQRLSDKLESLGDAIMGMQIVLDTGELVGATSPQMDAAFGTMQMRKGRGN